MRTPTRKGRLLALLSALLLCATVTAWRAESHKATGEQPAGTDPWGPLKLLEGSWVGEIDGKLGTGKGFQRYVLILRDQYLMRRHVSIRLPQEKSPKGDQREELGVYSFDSDRKKIVLREFLIEGVVVRSTCEVNQMTVSCASEAVESGPGIRSRMTLEFESRYRFTERYELGWPGKELELYSTNTWTRTPAPTGWN